MAVRQRLPSSVGGAVGTGMPFWGTGGGLATGDVFITGSATIAHEWADAAALSAANANTSLQATLLAQSATEALLASAITSEGNSAASAAAALSSANDAALSANNALASENAAASSAADAANESAWAWTQAQAAAASAAAALVSEANAAASAATATTQASTATTQAGIATTQAGIATTQAGIATTQAGIATTGAGTATTKASEALTSANNASADAGNALISANNAFTSASNADISEANAATSATNASNSATAAATSATSAAASLAYLAEPNASNDFSALNGWTGSGLTISIGGNKATLTTTTTDPQFIRTGLGFSGATFRYIAVRLRRITGTSNVTFGDALGIYWSRTAPTVIPFGSPVFPMGGKFPITNGTWYNFTYDMGANTNWASATNIDALRMDFATVAGDVWEIDYFLVFGDIVGAAYNAATLANANFLVFDKRYLGTKTTDPTLDNQGEALQVGAQYFNSTLNDTRVLRSGGWISASAGTTLTRWRVASVPVATNSITGNDDAGQPLAYTAGLELVYINGLLITTADYTRTSSSNITTGSTLPIGTTVEVIVIG